MAVADFDAVGPLWRSLGKLWTRTPRLACDIARRDASLPRLPVGVGDNKRSALPNTGAAPGRNGRSFADAGTPMPCRQRYTATRNTRLRIRRGVSGQRDNRISLRHERADAGSITASPRLSSTDEVAACDECATDEKSSPGWPGAIRMYSATQIASAIWLLQLAYRSRG